jgi:hypothetical protein
MCQGQTNCSIQVTSRCAHLASKSVTQSASLPPPTLALAWLGTGCSAGGATVASPSSSLPSSLLPPLLLPVSAMLLVLGRTSPLAMAEVLPGCCCCCCPEASWPSGSPWVAARCLAFWAFLAALACK